RRRTEDHIEEAAVALDFGQPALVLDRRLQPLLLAMREDAGEIAGLAEDVQILGGAVDAGIAVHGERAGDEERKLAVGEQAKAVGIELVGVGGSEVGRRRRRRGERLVGNAGTVPLAASTVAGRATLVLRRHLG